MATTIYSVQYNAGSGEVKYVGSISDYQDGGTTDIIPMTKQEAEQLLQDLDHYVRTKEQFGNGTPEEREQALWAYDHKEWGFQIDELELPDEEDDEDAGFSSCTRNQVLAMAAEANDVEIYRFEYEDCTAEDVCSHNIAPLNIEVSDLPDVFPGVVKLMTESEYNDSVWDDMDEVADFSDRYGDGNAKVLVVIVPLQFYKDLEN